MSETADDIQDFVTPLGLRPLGPTTELFDIDRGFDKFNQGLERLTGRDVQKKAAEEARERLSEEERRRQDELLRERREVFLDALTASRAAGALRGRPGAPSRQSPSRRNSDENVLGL